jgi:hypothetical protein
VPSTLPLDSGSALVEAREKKTAQGTASMPTTVTLHRTAITPHEFSAGTLPVWRAARTPVMRQHM